MKLDGTTSCSSVSASGSLHQGDTELTPCPSRASLPLLPVHNCLALSRIRSIRQGCALPSREWRAVGLRVRLQGLAHGRLGWLSSLSQCRLSPFSQCCCDGYVRQSYETCKGMIVLQQSHTSRGGSVLLYGTGARHADIRQPGRSSLPGTGGHSA